MLSWRILTSFIQPCSISHATHMRGTMATPMPICTKRLMLSMVGISMGMLRVVLLRPKSSITRRRKGDSTLCATKLSPLRSATSTSLRRAGAGLGGTAAGERVLGMHDERQFVFENFGGLQLRIARDEGNGAQVKPVVQHFVRNVPREHAMNADLHTRMGLAELGQRGQEGMNGAFVHAQGEFAASEALQFR